MLPYAQIIKHILSYSLQVCFAFSVNVLQLCKAFNGVEVKL